MKKTISVALISAVVFSATVAVAGSCYRVNAKYSDGSIGVKCSNGKQTTIYTGKGYKIGGTGYRYSSLDAAARAACGC